MIDQYEKKIEQQKTEIADLTRELIESYQSTTLLNEQLSR
jgi:septal ring factor EnvC (AmiA/AmiB activator)